MAAIDLPTELVRIDRLHAYPGNARQGDIGVIVESLRTLGQYRPIVVNRRADADTNMTVLAGNHTIAAAEMLGWKEIVVSFVDVDDDTAARINVVDNRANDLAGYDDYLLAELLTELAQTDLGLTGTGYDGEDLDVLLADLNADSFFPVDVDEQGKLDTVAGDTRIECPKCGERFPWSNRANK